MMIDPMAMMCAVMRAMSAPTKSRTSKEITVPQAQIMVDIIPHTAAMLITHICGTPHVIIIHHLSRSMTGITVLEIMGDPLRMIITDSTLITPTMRMVTSTAGAFPTQDDIITKRIFTPARFYRTSG